MAADSPPAPIEIGATRLWEREVHGTAGQHPMFDPGGSALYYSDGWGRRPAPSLRFRRLDVRDGTETATWPCGSAVRCLLRSEDGDLLVATDQRLARLDAGTLAERARWDRSVKHATSLAVHEGVAVAANSVTPTVTLIDLETGDVRRKRHAPVVTILGRRSGPPVLVGTSGGLSAIEPRHATIRPLRSTPPAMAATLADDELGAWLIVGIKTIATQHHGGVGIRPGDAAMDVTWHPLGDGPMRSLAVPAAVRTVDTSHETLWLTPAAIPGSQQYVVVGAVAGDDWRLWRAPERALVEAVAPSLGLVVTTTHQPGATTTVFSCYRLDRAVP